MGIQQNTCIFYESELCCEGCGADLTRNISRKKIPRSVIWFNIVGGLAVTLLAAACLVPFLTLISGSLSDNHLVYRNGVQLWPQGFTLQAYRFIFRKPERIITAFGVSVFVTLVGTVVGLLLLTMTAYVISRKDFRFRRFIAFYFYLTTLFNGGMVCTYIFYIRYYGLKDSFLAIILPNLTQVLYMLIMRNFVAKVPDALIESAKIDGAGELRIFFRIVLPLLQSGLATIGLFLALTYWNDWYNAMLYINSEWKYPLQYLLYKAEKTQSITSVMAMTCITMAPVLLLYPFMQKYFVQGITVGSIKG